MLLASYRRDRILRDFVIDETLAVIPVGEALCGPGTVLEETLRQIVRDAGVEDSTGARKDVDPELPHNLSCRESIEGSFASLRMTLERGDRGILRFAQDDAGALRMTLEEDG